MRNEQYLGEFEELVLLAIARLGTNAYGVTIQDALERATNREPSFGALYTTLERLEKKGFVSSRMGDPTPERGGRAKKFFKIEASGQQALNETEQNRRALRGDAVLQPIGGAV